VRGGVGGSGWGVGRRQVKESKSWKIERKRRMRATQRKPKPNEAVFFYGRIPYEEADWNVMWGSQIEKFQAKDLSAMLVKFLCYELQRISFGVFDPRTVEFRVKLWDKKENQQALKNHPYDVLNKRVWGYGG